MRTPTFDPAQVPIENQTLAISDYLANAKSCIFATALAVGVVGADFRRTSPFFGPNSLFYEPFSLSTFAGID
jgi:hypothetical protein